MSSKIHYVDKNKLLHTASKYILDVRTVLDIGCGIMPQKLIWPEVHICCEPFKQYVEVLEKKVRNATDRNFVIINTDWTKACELFAENSVDTMILLDVIEHIDAEEAKINIEKSEIICRKQLIIFTPLGFLPQKHKTEIDAWGLHGAHMQEHKSGWHPEDFGEGWDIIISEDFHELDNEGNKFEKPYGAMFAIKTFEKQNINYSLLNKYNRIIKIKKFFHKVVNRIKRKFYGS